MIWLYHGEIIEYASLDGADLAPFATWAASQLKTAGTGATCHRFSDDRAYETLLLGVRLRADPAYGGAEYFDLDDRGPNIGRMSIGPLGDKLVARIMNRLGVEPSFRGFGLRATAD